MGIREMGRAAALNSGNSLWLLRSLQNMVLNIKIKGSIGAALILACLATLIFIIPGCDMARLSFHGDITLAVSALPDHISPLNGQFGNTVNSAVFETLIRYDRESDNYLPGLARFWNNTHFGLIWTFTLQKDIFFHDGTPLNAAYAVKSLKNSLKHSLSCPYHCRGLAHLNSIIEDMQPLNQRDLVIRLSEPYPDFLAVLASPVSAIFKSRASTDTAKASYHIGTGPFMISHFVPGIRAVLTRNPAYTGKFRHQIPALSQLLFKDIGNDRARAVDLMAGTTDYAENIAPSESLKFSRQIEPTTVSAHPLGAGIAFLNCRSEPLNSVQTRHKLTAMIDTGHLFPEENSSSHQPFDGIAGFSRWLFDTDMFDLAADTGEINTCPPEHLCPEERLYLEERFNEDSPFLILFPDRSLPFMLEPDAVAAHIAGQLEAHGIVTRTQAVKPAALPEELRLNRHHMLIWGVPWPSHSFSHFLTALLYSRASTDSDGSACSPRTVHNMSALKDRELDSMLEQLHTEQNFDNRQMLYQKILNRAALLKPFIPLSTPKICAVNTSEYDFPSSLTGGIDLSLMTYRNGGHK